MFELLRYYIWRSLVLLARRLRIFMVVNKRIGLKNLNFNLLVEAPKGLETLYVEPDNLFLGSDFLVDKFTLINCPIQESPHFELMKAISENRDIKNTDYFHRYVDGKLDWRDVQSPKMNIKTRYIDKFFEAKETLTEGTYQPVKVYRVHHKYYIYDGKHRAAMCALYNQPVKCEIVDPREAVGKIGEYMFQCIIKKPQFSRHLDFYKFIK